MLATWLVVSPRQKNITHILLTVSLGITFPNVLVTLIWNHQPRQTNVNHLRSSEKGLKHETYSLRLVPNLKHQSGRVSDRFWHTIWKHITYIRINIYIMAYLPLHSVWHYFWHKRLLSIWHSIWQSIGASILTWALLDLHRKCPPGSGASCYWEEV